MRHRPLSSFPNPAHKNPYEVRSASGLEGVYANEGDAEFHADELRRSGVSGVVVERRVHQRGGMARSNPTSDFGGPHPDWAESNENAVRDALARSSTKIAEVLKRYPESVSSSDRAKYRKDGRERESFERADWKRVYVLTEYGIGDPFSPAHSKAHVYPAFQKAVELLKRTTGEEWMWDSINPGKQVFVMLDSKSNPAGLTAKGERMYRQVKRGYEERGEPRAAEIASRTVLSRVGSIPGLRSNPPGALTSDHLMFIGASLRDELVEEIDSTDWDNVVADRAAKVKSLLLGAAKQGKGFVIDTRRLTSKDYEFLSDNLEDGVARNMKNIADSRGVGLGQIGRQIRDFRESIGRFGRVLPEENTARRTRSNPPGALTYGHFYRTGSQDCANVISLDEFDLDLGTAEQIVADATSDWDDDLERDWRSQMDDEDFEGLDPHEAFEQWKAGWRARATRIIAEKLEERRDEDEDEDE